MNDIEILEKEANMLQERIVIAKENPLTKKKYIEEMSRKRQAIENLLKRNKELEEYANWHIEHISEDIADYIDDDKIGNKNIIGELKEEREHWKDIKRIMNNEKTYINYKTY